MKITTKETILTDGSKVYDINIATNGGPLIPKVIISCHSENAAERFIAEFENLLREYTVECLERD